MSDVRLRALERRWKEDGHLEAGVEWARELLRLGIAADHMTRFADMWGPKSTWRLLRRVEYRQHLIVKFAGDSPSIGEVRAVREFDASLGELSAKEALNRLRHQSEVDLGEHPGMHARRLFEQAKSLGLDAVLEDRSHTEILPLAKGEHEPRRFCDPGIEEEVVLRMLASGIEITEAEEVD